MSTDNIAKELKSAELYLIQQIYAGSANASDLLDFYRALNTRLECIRFEKELNPEIQP